MDNKTVERIVYSVAKGSFCSMIWERPVKLRKAFSNNVITKRSTGVVRFGINYDNIGVVKEKREAGVLPAKNQGLRWGEWVKFPYIIENKGDRYLRCTPSKNNRVMTQYFMNGKPVDKAEIAHMFLASELRETLPDVFSVKTDHIIAISQFKR